jgi:hypothetical protein
MADDSLRASSNTLIAGRFAVDTSQVLVDAGGGITSYLARDRLAADGKRAALMVSRDASPRARTLNVLNEPIDNLMMPLGHGPAQLPGGKEGYFVVCTLPPGPPLSAGLNIWPEKALIDLVLRPVARVLDVLHSRKLTHRAIRPNNVFQSAPGQPVTLGAAWAAPPAMHQPAVFESPYTAMCHPTGRGEGSIADDVYALGVLLLTLAGGKVPLGQFDDLTAIRWKLDQGSFAALTRDVSISSSFADLLRGMLAEDPDHRSPPSLLLDPATARTRRVAGRPAKRSQRALMLNDIAVFDARMLAFALFSDEKKAVQFLRNGLVTQWLRRGLGDAGLAAQIEDLVRGRAADTKSGNKSDSLLVMHTVAVISPRMPLCWRGTALWPDSLPALLAGGIASQSDLMAVVEELLVNDITGHWSEVGSREDWADSAAAGPDLPEQRQFLKNGGPGGLLRLFYGMNPLLPCRAPAMAPSWIANMRDLMGFLERTAEKAGDTLIDLHVAAFIAARADRKAEMQVNGLIASKDADMFRLGELELLQDLQSRYHPVPMPALAKWVAQRLRPDLDRWRNRPRRAALQARLDALAKAGFVARLLALMSDTTARSLDIAGAQRASAELAMIDAEVAAIDTGETLRFADAERFGQAITGGIGLSAFILMVMSVLLR